MFTTIVSSHDCDRDSRFFAVKWFYHVPLLPGFLHFVSTVTSKIVLYDTVCAIL